MNYKIKELLTRKTSFQERKELLADVLYDLYTDFIIVPYETMERFIYWGWQLRKNQDWSIEYFFYYYNYLKLKKFINYCEKYGHLQWNSDPDNKAMRKVKLACYLAKRLWEDNYNTQIDKHYEKWHINILDDWEFGDPDESGCRELKSKREKELSKTEAIREHNECIKARDEDDLQKKNEKELFFRLLSKHIEHWVD